MNDTWKRLRPALLALTSAVALAGCNVFESDNDGDDNQSPNSLMEFVEREINDNTNEESAGLSTESAAIPDDNADDAETTLPTPQAL